MSPKGLARTTPSAESIVSSMSTSAKSIYRNQSVHLRTIFEKAKSPQKVLCVAIDYAKSKHLALICDGNGEIMKEPITVHNSLEGVEFLIDEVRSTACRRKIPDEQIFFGGEDLPSYIENFARAIAEQGFYVARVNAWQAKECRGNYLASTDCIDLMGIAKTMLSRRARSAIDPLEDDENIYLQIRDLTRTRRQLVRQRTAASNRIHTSVDRLFPGFLDSSQSGITPLSNASCALMKDRFSAPQIARRKHGTLSKFLRRSRIHKPEEKAAQLLALASNAMPPDPSRLHSLQATLSATVELYECLDKNALNLRTEAALLLAQTPYVMLTTMGGFGFTLASGWASELGDPSRLPSTDSLCGYGGIVPKTSQSGGEDKAATQGRTSKRCNRIFKDWLVQSSGKVAQYGPDEWKQRHAGWIANNQHAQFAGARRLIRTSRTLLKYQIPWMDSRTRASNATKETKARAAEEIFERLVKKWRVIPDWEEVVFAQDRPLGFWRKVQIELHGADLPLTQID